MGLDMYLNKHTYVKHWEHNGDNNYEVTVTKAGNPTNIDPKKVKYIIEEAGYWRKANQIHRWFVDNVQNGVDNCGDYYVSTDDLEKLLEVCIAVNLNHEQADTLLPSASGFFFGNTEYDEWYFKDIDNTIEILKEALADESDSSYYYSSSW
jgi:hypothetical protein